MCLEIITTKHPKRKSGSGWKQFHNDGGVLSCYFQSNTSTMPIGVWVHEKHFRPARITRFTRLIAGDMRGDSYPTGWHIYIEKPNKLEESSNYDYNYRKVKYRGAHTIGRQWGKRVIVAKEILICEE